MSTGPPLPDIAAVITSVNHIRSLENLNGNLLQEIEYFFVSYNRIKGRDFRPLGQNGPDKAWLVVEDGMKRFKGE